VVDDISHKDSSAHVLILGRNNKDIESILVDRRIYIDHKHKTDTKTPIIVSDYPKMQFAYSTVHGSKGLEEDYVIIINGDDSRLGFPNKMEDDELLDLVLSSKSNYPYAEERRLWYVALTRARLYTYIIADEYSPSEFVKEIEDQCEVLNPESQEKHEHEISCPRCKSGRLVLRASPDGRKFYGCSNYPYCDYTINDLKAAEDNRRCPVCGDFLILKHGKYGKFYGCHNYKNGCRHTEKVDED
jgi:DNA helicase-4